MNATARSALLIAMMVGTACGADNSNVDKVKVQFRVDLVGGATQASAVTTIDGRSKQHPAVSPGQYLEAGDIAVNTDCAISATNTGESGAVRVHILVDNCFRASELCTGLCTVEASYRVNKEDCIN